MGRARPMGRNTYIAQIEAKGKKSFNFNNTEANLINLTNAN